MSCERAPRHGVWPPATDTETHRPRQGRQDLQDKRRGASPCPESQRRTTTGTRGHARCADAVPPVRRSAKSSGATAIKRRHPQNQLGQSLLRLEPANILATACPRLAGMCDLGPLSLASGSPSVEWGESLVHLRACCKGKMR